MATLRLPSARDGNYSYGGDEAYKDYSFMMDELRLAPESGQVALPPAMLKQLARAGERPAHYTVNQPLGILVQKTNERNENPVGGYWAEVNLRLKECDDPCFIPLKAANPSGYFALIVPNTLTLNLAFSNGTSWAITGSEPILLEPDQSLWDALRKYMLFAHVNAHFCGRNRYARDYAKQVYSNALLNKAKFRPSDEERSTGRLLLTSKREAFEFPTNLFRHGLLRFGVADDLSSLRTFATHWGKVSGFTHIEDPLEQEQRVPWSRVFIHRGQDAWRFLFAMYGRTAREEHHGAYGSGTVPPTLPCLHMFPVVVPHDETGLSRRAWRGLPLAVQEAIWGTPGMSSALSHALNMMKARVAGIADARDNWNRAPLIKLGHCIGFTEPNQSPWNIGFNYRCQAERLEHMVGVFSDRAGRNSLIPAMPPVAPVVSKRTIEL